MRLDSVGQRWPNLVGDLGLDLSPEGGVLLLEQLEESVTTLLNVRRDCVEVDHRVSGFTVR